MKNYYEILEVSKNASPEVIEKAYKALAKKYHPDVQTPDKIKWAEDKFKEIGEAYEILSNDEKRSSYDLKLENEFNNSQIDANSYDTSNNIDNSIYEDLQAHNQELQQEINNLKLNSNTIKNNDTANNISKEEITDIINNATNKAYQDAYIKHLKDYGYRIKYKKSFKTKFKNFISLLLTILVLIAIGYILWHIPTIKRSLIDFYNSNDVLKLIVNLFN